MSATAIPVKTVNGPYTLESLPQFNSVVFGVADKVNGNFINMPSQGIILIFTNPSFDDVTVSIPSVPNQYGRVADISELVTSGDTVCREFVPFGWSELGTDRLEINYSGAGALNVIALAK